ncbi:hypothetical protein CFB84_22890 [Burkholderia aenigmatica]|uniref:Uncharacterized protein n=1 Tax=Burkholderia aenigmatica TaxID=2015348 RepID=A0A228IIU2_9BURK|nr:hypothetical protein HR51_08830 [Burkholderia cepacia]OXI42095.1 hypothetical protein CFB84_22890 [Burkholderia aenigmatica]
MLRLIVLDLVFGVLAFSIGAAVLHALRSGVANAGGTRVARRSRPYAFALVVIVQIGFVVLLCWSGIALTFGLGPK